MTNALKIVDGTIIELTQEEKEAIEAAVKEYGKKEAERPLEPYEVYDLMAKKMANTVDIDDKTALRMKDYYPTFESIIGKEVPAGFKFTYKSDLWKVRQKHTPQDIYPTSVDTASLYERINETNTGTKEDPIPYDQTMEVYEGLYYTYGDVLYLCIRNSGQPLYAEPNLLPGYFEVVEPDVDDPEEGSEDEDEEPMGSQANPIPYDQTQPVLNGLYYIHDGVTYLCIRDSGIGLNADPGSLLSNYFKLAE